MLIVSSICVNFLAWLNNWHWFFPFVSFFKNTNYCCHTTDANINFFINSFNKLKKNRIYIIEDVHILELNNTIEKLKKFNPELIFLQNKNVKYQNNNLVIIRND